MINFDNLLHPMPARLAVAVSGGADSFALLHLAQSWANEKNIPLIALTVDHQLRPESMAEAQNVAKWCKTNKIEHHILQWTSNKPQTGLQDAARQARRRLLCDFCQEHDIPVLLLGHQADDQAETFVMRLQRGSGIDGLTGIPLLTIDETTGISIVRPLLHLRRHELRNYATQHELPFTDDPSNENDAFERARLRKILAQLPDLADGITKTAQRLTHGKNALDEMTVNWMQQQVIYDKDTYWFSRDAFLHLPIAVRQRILAQCLSFSGSYMPLDGIEDLAHAMEQPDFAGQTLGQSWIRPKIRQKKPGFLVQNAPPRNS